VSDFILIDGDIVNFIPAFSPATVVVMPGTLSASGKKASVTGKKVCVEGDEKNVSVPGCAYMTPQYVIPGVGTLKIDSLAGDQTAKKLKDSGKAVLLKGSQFKAVFEVTTPAQQPPPGPGSPIPDSTTKYTGKGSFISTNMKWKSA